MVFAKGIKIRRFAVEFVFMTTFDMDTHGLNMIMMLMSMMMSMSFLRFHDCCSFQQIYWDTFEDCV